VLLRDSEALPTTTVSAVANKSNIVFRCFGNRGRRKLRIWNHISKKR